MWDGFHAHSPNTCIYVHVNELLFILIVLESIIITDSKVWHDIYLYYVYRMAGLLSSLPV